MVCFGSGSCHLRGRKAMLRIVDSVHQTKQRSIIIKTRSKRIKRPTCCELGQITVNLHLLWNKTLQVDDDVKLVLLASSTRPRGGDFLVVLAHWCSSYFRSSSSRPLLWLLKLPNNTDNINNYNNVNSNDNNNYNYNNEKNNNINL